ncbi:MAG: LCP family protein [Candidatus Saccharimonadaceae bacterium]|nr:LCP family protein [Candidatus Saccharimonadaceae bacterium]
MDSNKSIDGLKPRRSTKATSLKISSKVPIPKSAKSPKSPSHTNTANHHTKTTKPKKAPKTTSTTKTAKPTKSTPPTTTQPTAKPSSIDINEDFLSPSQIFDFDDASGELKAADITSSPDPQDPSSSKKHKKGKKQKKPMSKKRKIILWIISIFILLIVGGVVWFILWGNSIIAKITDGQGNLFDLITETYAPLKTDANGRTNILAFGTSGYNMDGDEGDGTHDGAQLTDSIMVISLDQETGDTAMLSVPRDLKASPTCTATGKINEVYWCNNMEGNAEQAGAEALIAEVSDILDIEIQYYAHVNWGSLVQIVDTLGGITVTVDEDIDDYYRYEAGGTYTMGGEEALWLARIRHGTAHGDFTRTASQQKILIAIKNRIFEKSLSITDLLSLASTLGDNLRTNFSIDEMKTLAHLSSSFDFDTMRQVSLIDPVMLVTTGTINGISYVLPAAGANNYLAIQNYVAKMFSSDPRSYENYTILVLNATDTPGLASSEQIILKDSGYDNIYIDDAPEGTYAEGYTLYNLTDTAPGTRKLLEEKYGAALPLESLPANISTDYDFILIVNPADTDSNN